ncbi:hypothetical protein VFPFJ_01667 [Purpureocillium lilacinum]|uniref:Uncharacterized protein n=1 Tax=Purpureocillium lilacinum TaxID=33203 RepID=A0A179HYR3_PURLI|nr:hypothetical protein VFPFJ_01667 [Purpureocillium lilacinum]OAQ95557.1 hypothetical protein VFPFJ_01667 [Purpureocillium lilacinum]
MGPDPYSEDGEPLLGRRSECQPTRPVRSGTRRCTKHGPILSDVNHNMSPQKGADRLTAGRPVNTAWLCLAQMARPKAHRSSSLECKCPLFVHLSESRHSLTNPFTKEASVLSQNNKSQLPTKEAYKCFTWTHGALSARYAADPCSRARNLGMGVGTGRSADAGKWGRRPAAIQGESFSSRALGQPVARRRNSRSMSRAFRPAPARARVSRPEAAAPRSKTRRAPSCECLLQPNNCIRASGDVSSM